MMQDTIELAFDETYITQHLYQSNEYDYTPKDLAISFDKKLLGQSKEIFKQFPDLFSITFDACVTSSNFDGKLRTDLIHFYNSSGAIFVSFTNDWTGSVYELDLSEKLNELLANQPILSPNSVYETVDNYRSC